jgi:hypothetical protein
MRLVNLDLVDGLWVFSHYLTPLPYYNRSYIWTSCPSDYRVRWVSVTSAREDYGCKVPSFKACPEKQRQ